MSGILGGILPAIENIFPIAGALGDVTGGGKDDKDSTKSSHKSGDLFGGLTDLLGGVMNIFQLAGGPDLLKGVMGGVGDIGGMASGGGLGDIAGSVSKLASLGNAGAGAAAVTPA